MFSSATTVDDGQPPEAGLRLLFLGLLLFSVFSRSPPPPPSPPLFQAPPSNGPSDRSDGFVDAQKMM
eukprot:9504170-Pyramimonas_sp.AAC.1